MQLSYTITFPQKRITPYYLMVQASNQLGYHPDNKTFSALLSEYAVDVPSIPLGLSASVVGVRLIRLNWITPVDTGVGDNSRPVVKFVLEQSTSPILDTIQTTFEPGPLVATLTVEVPTTGPSPFYFRIAANKEGEKKKEREEKRENRSCRNDSCRANRSALRGALQWTQALTLEIDSFLVTGVSTFLFPLQPVISHPFFCVFLPVLESMLKISCDCTRSGNPSSNSLSRGGLGL